MAFPDIEFLFRGLDDTSDVPPRVPRVALRVERGASHGPDVVVDAVVDAMADAERAEELAQIARFVAGDAAAFDDVFRRHFLPLTTYVRRFVDSADTAEDLAQEALVHVWERRETIRPDAPLTPLLRTMVRRAALKRLRHLRIVERETAPLTALNTPPGASAVAPLPDAVVDRAEVMDAVRAALAALPPRIRMVAVMRWLDGLSRQEVAAELSVSVRTVDAQLYQAATRIRAAVASYRTESGG